MMCRKCPNCGSEWYSADTRPWPCEKCFTMLTAEHEIPLGGRREKMRGNLQAVSVCKDGIMVLFPKRRMSREEALEHAAWIVALAEEREGEFEEYLKNVKST